MTLAYIRPSYYDTEFYKGLRTSTLPPVQVSVESDKHNCCVLQMKFAAKISPPGCAGYVRSAGITASWRTKRNTAALIYHAGARGKHTVQSWALIQEIPQYETTVEGY